MTRCPGCGAEAGHDVPATERMFGLGGSFTYRACDGCGTLRLMNPPSDFAPYYPPGYYAHDAVVPSPGFVSRWLRRRRAASAFGAFDPVGRIVRLVRPDPDYFGWLRRAGATPDSSILEIGAGSGFRLVAMAADGFTRVLGADPYVRSDLDLPFGVRVVKRHLAELSGSFDVILLLHVLEHLPDPAASLRDLYRLTSPGGAVVVRTPVAGCFAWRTYGAEWVQLDAPRHLVIFSPGGLMAAARSAGFAAVELAHDSEAFQFWGSESYRRGTVLREADPVREFGAAAVEAWTRRAAELNAAADGDQVCAVLRKAAA